MKKLLILLSTFVFLPNAFARTWLPSIFSDNMVLQQGEKSTLWGWTDQRKLTLLPSWDNKPVEVTPYQCKWEVALKTPKASLTTYTITIKEEDGTEIILKNILIGEVWLCSGQSNMEWSASNGLFNKDEEIKNAHFPHIRFFKVQKSFSSFPQENTYGQWVECSPETMSEFSAVAYFFAREIYKNTNLPVGLIGSYWGGTYIELWLSKQSLDTQPDLTESIKVLSQSEVQYRPSKPSYIYNAMIYPLITYNIAGCIWYQGETNRVNAETYYRSLPLLINSWRKDWNKKFPFYIVQITPHKDSPDELLKMGRTIVRDAQLQTMKNIPLTGMAVTNDIGDLNNIHPLNKQEVGRRLSLWALAKNYGRENLEYSGPIYRAMKIQGNKIILSFEHSEGLTSKGGKLREFQIAGNDKQFYPAEAKIKNNAVIVSSRKVKNPEAVRFAFSDIALPNLYNKVGLPASAFRTDNW